MTALNKPGIQNRSVNRAGGRLVMCYVEIQPEIGVGAEFDSSHPTLGLVRPLGDRQRRCPEIA